MQNKSLLYDAFNARYLSFQEVAESFISNDEFFQLTGNNSILLMGPRGCGKTTLLKMLTPAGLNYWKESEAENVKNNLNFTAVYIPSDIQWKNQFDYLNKHLSDKKEFVEVITQFLFASNVQMALCKSFHSVITFGDFSDEERILREFAICNSLIKAWRLGPDSPSTFDDIELEILGKVRFVNAYVKRVIFQNQKLSIEEKLPDYVFDGFFDLVKLGCKAFEVAQGVENNHKWALCFDELEIVPKFIQFELIKYLRSVDQKFVFKLTTTPLFNLENNVLEATQGNDFGTVKLWVYDETGLTGWRKFCERLLEKRFEKIYEKKGVDFELVFGKYNLDGIIKDELDELSTRDKELLGYEGKLKSGSGKGSYMNYLFKRLTQKDPSFKDFLEKRGVDSKDPYSDDMLIQKSIFLKYKVDAVFRMIYKDRTRKTPPIHYGLPYIYDVSDGNPRLIIGLIDDVLQSSKFDLIDNVKITKQEQSKIIYTASDKYFNLIRNHPDATINANNNEVNLATNLLEVIGEFILNKTIRDKFSKTSPSTFRVDEGINHKYLSLLETALSLGAIVYLDPIESLSNTGIVGKRFRLSKFLTPKFKISNKVNSEVRLSTILKAEQSSKGQTKLDY